MIPIDKLQCQKLFEWIDQRVADTHVPSSDPNGEWINGAVEVQNLDCSIQLRCFPTSASTKNAFSITTQGVLGEKIIHWLRQLACVTAYTGIDAGRLERVTQRAQQQHKQMAALIECRVTEQLWLASRISLGVWKWIALFAGLRGPSLGRLLEERVVAYFHHLQEKRELVAKFEALS